MAAILGACGGGSQQDNAVLAPVQAAVSGSATPTAAAPDEYDALRAKWITQITGGCGANRNDADVNKALASSRKAALDVLAAMKATPTSTSLWKDDGRSDWTLAYTITANYDQLRKMAIGWSLGRCDSTMTPAQSEALATAVLRGLEWMYANHYNKDVPAADWEHVKNTPGIDWFNLEIGAPQKLDDIILLMYDRLPQAQRDNYLGVIDRFVPDPTLRTTHIDPKYKLVEDGANLADKALVVLLRGIAGKSEAKVKQGHDAVAGVLRYVDKGNGFYVDGSLVQHNHIAYTGSYGRVLLTDIAGIYDLLDGSRWSMTAPGADSVYATIYDEVRNAYKPLVYKGAIVDAVRGRAIARENQTDHVYGRLVMAALAQLARVAPAAEAASLKSTLKYWLQADTTFTSYPSTYSPYDIANVKAIKNDAGIVAENEQVGMRVYAGMDRVVSRQPDHAAVVSLFSDRIAAFESTSKENLKGWWTGAGMTNIYNADLEQYSGSYWATIDPQRLPGTTTDASGSGTPADFGVFTNTGNWAGGSQVDNAYATSGLDFSMTKVTGSALRGRKSWFMFGDKIVALGTGIGYPGGATGRAVETVVENRKLNAKGTNVLTVNGNPTALANGQSVSLAGTRWAHLSVGIGGADIGYWFPEDANHALATVDALSETRGGSWQAVDANNTHAAAPNTFLSLALKHGVQPASASYAYAILPNYDAARTAAFANSPTVKIVMQTTEAHAVRDTRLDASGASFSVTGVNFWVDGEKTVWDSGLRYLTSKQKASVTVVETGTELRLGVADPTQANTGTIELELNRSAWDVLAVDKGVTVTQLYPTVKLSVDVNQAHGKTFGVRLAKGSTALLAPIADATVQDGSLAATNAGTVDNLATVNGGAGATRQAVLKFNLGIVPGTIVGARLVMMPIALGTGPTGTVIANRVSRLASNAWSESGATGVTWNTLPAVDTGGDIGSWAVPQPGVAVRLDVTAAAALAVARDKYLSLKIDSAANYGAAGYVTYASREATTAANRPVLQVLYR